MKVEQPRRNLPVSIQSLGILETFDYLLFQGSQQRHRDENTDFVGRGRLNVDSDGWSSM
jgi:hypothetical protein